MAMATDNRAVPLTDGPATSSPLLGVEDLGIAFGATKVVEGLRFSVDPGRTLAIVGESGSGKSITSLAVMGLLGSSASVSGRALFRRRDGEVVDLLRLSPGRSRALRGDEIAMVFQEPMTALNPVLRIGDQLVEVLRNHGRPTRGAARARAL
ncbi:MAG: ATP-binding cassette domain-containing protein, partial [Rhodospirillum sp.]|nr:ATP-binding cassette domain-containing protein [Rhodospirillum sp.]